MMELVNRLVELKRENKHLWRLVHAHEGDAEKIERLQAENERLRSCEPRYWCEGCRDVIRDYERKQIGKEPKR
jgi:hypothetical protein